MRMRLGNSNAPFPLTPALSLGERETRRGESGGEIEHEDEGRGRADVESCGMGMRTWRRKR